MPTSSTPRYQQLADVLARHIQSGRYPVGSLLPPETDLAQQYDMSRHTVREAIRKLADMGLILRRQGVGTEVRAKQPESRYVAALNTLSDLFQYTQRTKLKVLGEEWVIADEELAAQLHCETGQRWLKFLTCRYPTGEKTPISYTEIFVYPMYEGIREQINNRSAWVHGLIESEYGEKIAEARQEIEPVLLSPDIAQLLHASAGTPALQVRRYYFDANGRLLSSSNNIYPEKRFKISTSWRLEWAK
jgi:DNA-binding GntR family transcriptional regulator